MRRVVITGLGLVSPLGSGHEHAWKRLTAGENAAKRIEEFEVSDLSCQVACQVPRGDGSDGTFNPNDWMEPKEQRKVDDFIIYAMGAATQALTDAGWKPTAYEDQIRTGVLIGSGIGGLQGIEKASLLFAEKGPRRISPFFIPGRLINLASGYVSIEHGLKGPNHAVVTACSTGGARHRRCLAPRGVWRCGCDARGRFGIADLPSGTCRLRRLSRAVDQFQRSATEGLASL